MGPTVCMGVSMWMDVGVCVCMRGYACASFILLLMKQPAASSLTTSGANIPCNSPTLHMHSVRLPFQLIPPPLPPSPPSPLEARSNMGPFQLGWAVLANCGQPSSGH